jgi:hypothetical protein
VTKAVCATHEQAYDVDAGCPYCEPPPGEKTDRTLLQSVDERLKQYVEGIQTESDKAGYYTSDTYMAFRMMWGD